MWVEPEKVFDQPKVDTNKISPSDSLSLEADKKFLQNLPQSYDNVIEKISNIYNSKYTYPEYNRNSYIKYY